MEFIKRQGGKQVLEILLSICSEIFEINMEFIYLLQVKFELIYLVGVFFNISLELENQRVRDECWREVLC